MEATREAGRSVEELSQGIHSVLQGTRTNGRCSLDNLRKCKVHFLVRGVLKDYGTVQVPTSVPLAAASESCVAGVVDWNDIGCVVQGPAE